MTTEGKSSAQNLRFAIVAGKFNSSIVEHLIRGAKEAFLKYDGNEQSYDLVFVPGAFEIPLAAKKCALTKKYDAIVCLGAVIRGKTAHFEYVSGECARGIAQVSLETNIPVIFGVLTTDTIEDALERTGDGTSNKGWEAAVTAMEMANLLKQIS